MTSRISVFNHFMEKLTEMDYPCTPRSWVMNGYGRCDFSLSTYDTKCEERYLQYGNLVHIEHIPTKNEFDQINGTLPTWTGIILPPRDWSLGILSVSAYSAESILKLRAVPYLKINGSAVDNFIQLISISFWRSKFVPISIGELSEVDGRFTDELKTNVYDHLQKLVKDSMMEWDIVGRIDKDKLYLYANLYSRRGIDTNFPLTNLNSELTGNLMSEQGTPSNEVFGYSQAYTSNSRYVKRAINQESYDDYGPLQINQVYIGKKDARSVNVAASVRAEERGRPVKIVPRNVLDKGDTFSYLSVGNSVIVKDNNSGFNKSGGLGYESEGRIMSLSYNDMSNKVTMSLEVE